MNLATIRRSYLIGRSLRHSISPRSSPITPQAFWHRQRSHELLRPLVSSSRNMASFQNLDDKSKSLIERSYPQAAGADTDAVKISSAAFPSAEVSSISALYTKALSRIPSSSTMTDNYYSTRNQKRRKLSSGSSHPRTSPRHRKMLQRQPSACPPSTPTWVHAQRCSAASHPSPTSRSTLGWRPW